MELFHYTVKTFDSTIDLDLNVKENCIKVEALDDCEEISDSCIAEVVSRLETGLAENELNGLPPENLKASEKNKKRIQRICCKRADLYRSTRMACCDVHRHFILHFFSYEPGIVLSS